MVPTDHLISPDTGMLNHTKGKSDTFEMFSGACVFIDHACGYVIINNQVNINATETIKSKLSCEKGFKIHGVVINGHHTDNGIFNGSKFIEEILNNQKKIRFSGAGASNQNGAIERLIKTLVTMGKTMLIHAALKCPEENFSTDSWSMEMDYAV